MLKEVEHLLVLQDRDKKLRSLRQELTRAPLERKQFDEKTAGSAAALEAVKQKAREVEVERKGLENDAASKRTQVAKYQVQKFETRKNEEFQAISTAIQHLEDEIRKIEDRELELMEATETLRPQIADAEKANQATKAMVTGQISDLEAKSTALAEQVKKIEGERAALAQEVEEELLDAYERLFKTKGEAVVALEGEVCTGCHMRVTASTGMRTRGGREVVHCEQCSRILYYIP